MTNSTPKKDSFSDSKLLAIMYNVGILCFNKVKTMEKIIMIPHSDFVEGYKKGEYLVYINESKAGDFVLSKPANKHNKPAYLFWSWAGVLMSFIFPIILLFISWKYSILSFVLGLIVIHSSRKSGMQFMLQNMLEDSNFWEYVLMYQGANIEDKNGDKVICSSNGKRRSINKSVWEKMGIN